MTDLAAKAREIVRQHRYVHFDPETAPRDAPDEYRQYEAILSALIEADAAATERAAKVAEALHAKYDNADFPPGGWWPDGPDTADEIATAIRNQEPSDA